MPTVNITKEDVNYMIENESGIYNNRYQQWQTIKEFMANPIEGWCFVCFSGHLLNMAYYFKDEKEFHDRDDSGYSFAARNITHVMPIKTPEPPK